MRPEPVGGGAADRHGRADGMPTSAACASARRVPTLGAVADDLHRDVADLEAGLADQPGRLGEQGHPDAPGQLGPGGAEVRAEVADAGGREERVAGGVGRDVGVGVAVEPALAGPVQAGDPELARRSPRRRTACTSTPMPTLGSALDGVSLGEARRPRALGALAGQHPLGVLEVVAAWSP